MAARPAGPGRHRTRPRRGELYGAHVCGNVRRVAARRAPRPVADCHHGAGGSEAPHDRLTHALASTGNKGALAGELRRIAREVRHASDPRGHGAISKRVIFSPATANVYRSSIGLPGKLPETRHVTTVPRPELADVTTSTVC